MWDFVQAVVVATRVLEIRFGIWELRQVSGTSEVCLPSAWEKVGTVLNVEDAKREMIAGAKFLMSPAMLKFVWGRETNPTIIGRQESLANSKIDTRGQQYTSK
ncbi:hypothetical protein L3X38_010517 [Prunus dulcis]|uniref:Uncharacterized protein n=1 Tax=Prunus dulcis TaxID=3755 RepID=A0AAD4WGB9_PRUDU|nr:hypothetical protein L3X38_010517 [Prunus dulcis]